MNGKIVNNFVFERHNIHIVDIGGVFHCMADELCKAMGYEGFYGRDAADSGIEVGIAYVTQDGKGIHRPNRRVMTISDALRFCEYKSSQTRIQLLRDSAIRLAEFLRDIVMPSLPKTIVKEPTADKQLQLPMLDMTDDEKLEMAWNGVLEALTNYMLAKIRTEMEMSGWKPR